MKDERTKRDQVDEKLPCARPVLAKGERPIEAIKGVEPVISGVNGRTNGT